MKLLSVIAQINALNTHATRNNITIYEFQVKKGYSTDDLVSGNGECVFAFISHPKSDSVVYITVPSIRQFASYK